MSIAYWTKEKVGRFQKTVEQCYKEGGQWRDVSELMGFQERGQCCKAYAYLFRHGLLQGRRFSFGRNADKKQPKTMWTAKEQERLLTAIESFGKNWKKIAEREGVHTLVQCVVKWGQLVNRVIRRKYLSREDGRIKDLFQGG
jgi:hypothetical protein